MLSACATPRSDLPPLETEAVLEARLAVQREAAAQALAREARILRLAWPILEKNAALCRETGPNLGLRLGDARTVRTLADGLTERQVRALGYDDAPHVLSVAPSGPSAALPQGSRVLRIAGEEASDLDRANDTLTEALTKEDASAVEFLVETPQGERLEMSLTPKTTCEVRVISSGRGVINAQARFETITIYAGLVRALEDDNALSFVIAHELPHVAGRHPGR